MLPFPPPPDTPDPPSLAFQLLMCILLPFLWFETIVLLLLERWRTEIYGLQFGWTK